MNPLETTSVYWHFPMLIVTASTIYAATRYEKWNQIFREAFVWGARMTLFLVAIGFGVHFLPWLDSRAMWITVGCVLAGYVLISFFRGRQPRRD
jgi:uncharacterized membrane protein YfcA